MSSPPNPLDVFSTYTYHFELYASADYDDISKIESNASTNIPTSPTTAAHVPLQSKPTLLINTRQDAHQIIDDVKFSYVGPSNNPQGLFIPDGRLTLKVFEPNRVYFLQKLQNLMKTHDVSNLSGLHWALKIYFVGRDSNNHIGVLTGFESGVTIPLAFSELTSTFGPKGGEYSFTFISLSSFAGSNDPSAESFVMLAGYFNQNLSIRATKVKEALNNLATELNTKYQETFATELRSPNMRTIKYSIVLHDFPDGSIDLVGGESFAPNSPVSMMFSCDRTIVQWIFDILRSSSSLNAFVGDSLAHVREPGHNGVNIFSVYPTYKANGRELELIYNVSMYKGSGTKNIYTFDFMFGKPGSNVDVLGFDMHMNSAQAWFSNTAQSSTNNLTGQGSGVTDRNQAALVFTEDKTQDKNVVAKGATFLIPNGKGKDPAFLPATSKAEKNGSVKTLNDKAAANQKIMFNTIVQMHGAFDAQFTFTIRGNLNLLVAGIIKPANSVGDLQKVIGVTSPTWIKVNVKHRQGENEPSDFFYTGLYNLLSIENHFVGGQFTQVLQVLMMGDENDKKNFNEAAPSVDNATYVDSLGGADNILTRNQDMKIYQQYQQNLPKA